MFKEIDIDELSNEQRTAVQQRLERIERQLDEWRAD